MTRRWAVPTGFGWGFTDQVVSSATNFALSVAAGRALGPRGLGVVFVGFFAYLITLGFARALVTNPVVVATDPDAGTTRTVNSHGLTLILAGGALSALCLFVAGLLIPGDLGLGLRIVAPWIVPALVQDYWRAVLFRDRRGGAATLNDAAWALTLLLGLPLLWVGDSPGAAVGWWGLGGAAGALVGFLQVRAVPSSLAMSWRWWRQHASLGRWLWVGSVIFYGAGQGVVFEVGAVLGTEDLGGLRAIDSVLTPLSVLRPAAELPGLPATANALRRSRSEAMTLALRISGAVALFAAVYLLVLGSVAGPLLGRLFGPEFERFGRLVVPLGVSQVATALSIGPIVLLKSEKRGRALAASTAAGAVVSLALVWPLAAAYGLQAAAWGMTTGTVVTAVLTIALATAPRRVELAAQG